MTAEQKKVLEFHRKYKCPIHYWKLLREKNISQIVFSDEMLNRLTLLLEEVTELTHAMKIGNLDLLADALGDILYVTYGAAVMLGIDMEDVFNEIHRSNMTKSGDAFEGKITKGGGYEAPQLNLILQQQDL